MKPTTNLQTLPAAAGIPDDFIFRLSVQQYHDMVRSGILTEDDPVELLEGWLVVKMSKNPPHSKSTGRVQSQLNAVLPAGYYTRAQEPITLDDSEPEPDIVVVRGTDDDYTDRHPGAGDVALVVEVANSTLDRDRTLKLGTYARAGIGIYWIVNLQELHVEVYSSPTSTGGRFVYADSARYAAGQSVPVIIAGQVIGAIAVADLLP